MQCDLFSLGEIKVWRGNKLVEDDPFLKLLNNPNPFQTKRQILWDYMFWLMFGNAYLYIDSSDAEKESNKLYFLDTQKIDFPKALRDNSDKLIFSKQSERDFFNHQIKYNYNDGTSIKLPYSKIITFSDLSNGMNWVKGSSRIDALYKIISNSEHSIDAKNVNIRYSGKFLVSNTKEKDLDALPMSDDEKEDIEKKIDDRKHVRATKSMVDIKRYVENIGQLKLDEAYLADYYLIGKMYGIPRDVLEAYKSSTYENQEKARGSHVSYTLKPKGDDFVNGIEKRLGYSDQGKDITISWDHLSFMEVFERQRSETEFKRSQTLNNLIKAGYTKEEASKYLELNFE